MSKLMQINLKKLKNAQNRILFDVIWMFVKVAHIKSDFGFIFQHKTKPHTYILSLSVLYCFTCSGAFFYRRQKFVTFVA